MEFCNLFTGFVFVFSSAQLHKNLKMFSRDFGQLLLLLLALPQNILGGPVSNPEISQKTIKANAIQHQQQQQQLQQQQHQQKAQDAHLNTLSVFASNYDIIANQQNNLNNINNNNGNNANNGEEFKPSYKLPDMETNFTPIQNGNSIAPEYATGQVGSASPVLMQYLPQTINEGGVQYLQLIPTRPLMVPIAPYLGSNGGGPTLGFTQTLTAPHPLDFSARPATVLSAMPMNMPPPAPAPLVEVPSHPLPAYGIQSYAAHLQPYKQNYRTNRETKDKQILGPMSLNMNEYIPGPGQLNQQSQAGFIRGRP